MQNANANAAFTSVVHVGKTPAGVSWNVYTDGKSESEIKSEIALQEHRLALLWQRHEKQIVRVRKLSATAIDLIECHYCDAWINDSVDDMQKDRALLRMGRTWIEGTRRMLADVAAVMLETQEDAIASVDGGGRFEMTDAQYEFAARSIRKSRQTIARKITSAIG